MLNSLQRYLPMDIGQSNKQLLAHYHPNWNNAHLNLKSFTSLNTRTETWHGYSSMELLKCNLHSALRSTYLWLTATKLWSYVCSTSITLWLTLRLKSMDQFQSRNSIMLCCSCVTPNKSCLIRKTLRSPSSLQLRKCQSTKDSQTPTSEWTSCLL